MAVQNRDCAPLPTADLQQGHYFHELLSHERAELDERIQELHAELARLDRVGDVAGVRSNRRIIKALESEGRLIDRMRNALRARLTERVPPDSATSEA
jgi:hypothetical protein